MKWKLQFSEFYVYYLNIKILLLFLYFPFFLYKSHCKMITIKGKYILQSRKTISVQYWFYWVFNYYLYPESWHGKYGCQIALTTKIFISLAINSFKLAVPFLFFDCLNKTWRNKWAQTNFFLCPVLIRTLQVRIYLSLVLLMKEQRQVYT